MADAFLLLAPGGDDARLTESILTEQGMVCATASPEEIVDAIGCNGFTAAIVAEEALALFDEQALADALASQPPWSDCPFLLIREPDGRPLAPGSIAELIGNITIIERPLRASTLVSAARFAARSRERQRRSEAYWSEHLAAEERVRELAETLEHRVAARTTELTQAMAERAAAEERMRESEELYRHTIELSTQIPWTADPEGDLLGVGARWLELTGHSLNNTLGDGWLRAIHPEEEAMTALAWREARQWGTRFDIEYRVRVRGGRYCWFRSRAAPRIGADGRVIRWYGTIEDVNERRQATERLQQVQAELIHVSRLSAIGAMASTLAHELNQPLTAIANYVRGSQRMLVGMDSEFSKAVVEALAEADQSALRAGEIVRRLRDLVARGVVERKPEDLPQLISQICRIALVDAEALGVIYRIELDRRAPTVLADRIQIQQVLINLLRNAIEAMEGMPVREIVIATSAVSEHFCQVSVQDSGPGLPPAVADQLFVPFNSTKPDGMGIGLSISRTIIEAHGGQIWAEPGERGGTVFRFTLPRP